MGLFGRGRGIIWDTPEASHLGQPNPKEDQGEAPNQGSAGFWVGKNSTLTEELVDIWAGEFSGPPEGLSTELPNPSC